MSNEKAINEIIEQESENWYYVNQGGRFYPKPMIVKVAKAYADQETSSLKERVRELEEGLNEIKDIALDIWHQHCQDDQTLDKAEDILAKISQLLPNQ